MHGTSNKTNHGYLEQVPNIFSAMKINGKKKLQLSKKWSKKYIAMRKITITNNQLDFESYDYDRIRHMLFIL